MAERNVSVDHPAATATRGDHEWLHALTEILNLCQLYRLDHPEPREKLERVCRLTLNLLEVSTGELILACTRDGLSVNGLLVREGPPAFRKLAETLRRHGVHSLVFLPGLSLEELRALVETLAESADRVRGRGGVQAVLEERNVRSIRLGRMRYAASDRCAGDAGTHPGSLEDCLEHYGAERSSGRDGGEAADRLAELLENPNHLLDLLGQRAADEDPADPYRTLDRACDVVHRERPQQWKAVKQSLSKALTLLPSDLRARLLQASRGAAADVRLLQDMTDELRPDQIARILAEHVCQERAGGNDTTPGRAAQGISAEFVDCLVQSPAHLEVLRPFLLEEFEQQGVDLSRRTALLEELCKGYVTHKRLDAVCAIDYDKMLIARASGKIKPRRTAEAEDVARSMGPRALQANLDTIRASLLEVESNPSVYADVLGTAAVQSAMQACARQDWPAARRALRPLLEHAGMQGEVADRKRAELARQALEPLPPGQLVSLLCADAETNDRLERDLLPLAQMRAHDALRELARRALDTENPVPEQGRLRAFAGEHMDAFADSLKEWLRAGNDPGAPGLWEVLERCSSEAAAGVLAEVALRGSPEIALRAVARIGELGGQEADAQLFQLARASGRQAAAALELLCNRHSTFAVPFLERRLLHPDSVTGRRKLYRKTVENLARIDSPDSRRVLAEFMACSRNALQQNLARPAVLEVLEQVRTWPAEEARSALEPLVRHRDRRVALAAQALVRESAVRGNEP